MKCTDTKNLEINNPNIKNSKEINKQSSKKCLKLLLGFENNLQKADKLVSSYFELNINKNINKNVLNSKENNKEYQENLQESNKPIDKPNKSEEEIYKIKLDLLIDALDFSFPLIKNKTYKENYIEILKLYVLKE